MRSTVPPYNSSGGDRGGSKKKGRRPSQQKKLLSIDEPDYSSGRGEGRDVPITDATKVKGTNASHEKGSQDTPEQEPNEEPGGTPE